MYGCHLGGMIGSTIAWSTAATNVAIAPMARQSFVFRPGNMPASLASRTAKVIGSRLRAGGRGRRRLRPGLPRYSLDRGDLNRLRTDRRAWRLRRRLGSRRRGRGREQRGPEAAEMRNEKAGDDA